MFTRFAKSSFKNINTYLSFILALSCFSGSCNEGKAPLLVDQETPGWTSQTIGFEEIRTIGSDDIAQKEYFLGYITDVWVDEADNIYVLDYVNGKVMKYSAEGRFLLSIGSGRGQGPGQFAHASKVSVDTDGSIYVGDIDQRRLVIFDKTGKFLRFHGTGSLNPVYGLAIHGEEIILAHGPIRRSKGKGVVSVINRRDFASLRSIGKSWEEKYVGNEIGAYSVCVDGEDQRIYLSYALPYRIEAFTTDGIFLFAFGKKEPMFDKIKRSPGFHDVAYGSSIRIIALPGGKIINVTRKIEQNDSVGTYYDFFDKNGRYLTTYPARLLGPYGNDAWLFKSKKNGNIVAVYNEPFPHIVEYKISFTESDSIH